MRVSVGGGAGSRRNVAREGCFSISMSADDWIGTLEMGVRTTETSTRVDATPWDWRPRIVYVTDWLPPHFSAVSQYALQWAERMASAGHDVVVVGLDPDRSDDVRSDHGSGSVRVVRLRRRMPSKSNWLKRLVWSYRTGATLTKTVSRLATRETDVVFTGSPPFLLHVIWVLKFGPARLTYRIADFYPEVIVAALGRSNPVFGAIQVLTNVLRRRVDRFEVLGEDQAHRLMAIGLPPTSMRLARDTSPVPMDRDARPLARPAAAGNAPLLLYSGNLGVAHDWETVLEGYQRHRAAGGTTLLWLSAQGSGLDALVAALDARGLPYVLTPLVPLADLASLLVTPDGHLVTLKQGFAGLVLPSKVYGCLLSGKPLVFVGPEASDVHLLATEAGNPYAHVDNADAKAFAESLAWIETMASRTPISEHDRAK